MQNGTISKLHTVYKNQNILPTIVRYGDIPKMCKLLILGNLVLSGYAHPRWQLVENLMFLFMPKINFIIHFFLWRITRELEFRQICDWWWKININTSFRFKIFPGKLMTRFFKKSKNPYFGTILGSFCPYLREKDFLWKKGLWSTIV